jgi:hypothetical protein
MRLRWSRNRYRRALQEWQQAGQRHGAPPLPAVFRMPVVVHHVHADRVVEWNPVGD